MPYVREYLEGDAEALAPILREADRREIQAASGRSPVEVLRQSAEESQIACTIAHEGAIAGMFGVAPSYPSTGLVWLLGSDLLTGPIRRAFIKQAPGWLDALHFTFPLLYNYIDERNTLHIHWLRKLGFTFISRHPTYGFEKRPFLEFVRLKHV